MEMWVGARLAIPWWESEEEGLVCVLSVCLARSLPPFTNGLWSELHREGERERITVQAERESETPSLQ